MNEPEIVGCIIHPGIGIARVGNSPNEYFVGPEVPGEKAIVPTYKDAQGAIKRQAARFRLYGLDAHGSVIRELTSDDAQISWSVHLANKKAAWYKFQLALDTPEAQPGQGNVGSTSRRNPTHPAADRSQLVIDPGPRQIAGKNVQGSAHAFDTGSFLGSPVGLGELRTDDHGRLLVVGGHGHSATPLPNNPAVTFGNNDGWHDDVSDGPVRASVLINGRTILATPAWIIVGPPAYAPGLEAVVSLFDIAYQAHLDAGRGSVNRSVSFARDVYPILRRLTQLQWVNQGFFEEFGWGAPNNLISHNSLQQVARRDPEAAAARHAIFNRFRSPHDQTLTPNQWPPIYGDSFDQPPSWPQQFLTVTREQYRCLKSWANGDFQADWNPSATLPQTLDALPVAQQPAALDQAALMACSGGPFHPGAEATWPLRIPTMYSDLCRIRVRESTDPPERDYGDSLSPEQALGADGPFHRSGPGDITRWMAVPWQTDTSSCGSAYANSGTSPYPDLPTFWPAAVPNRILTRAAYQKILDEGLPLDARRTAFKGRVPWSRHLPQDYQSHINAFVTEWSQMGIVTAQPGPPGDGNFPTQMHVETENTFSSHPPSVQTALAAGQSEDEAERTAFADQPSMPQLDNWRAHL
jgi:L-Lysine epsilon oxidase N-terminal/L-lysine epsilon oxidase C-terminal domain